MNHRTIKGLRQFLVRWKGYGESADTWENEKDLNCPDLIEEYLEEENSKETEPPNTSSEASKTNKTSKTKKSKSTSKKDAENGMFRLDDAVSFFYCVTSFCVYCAIIY